MDDETTNTVTGEEAARTKICLEDHVRALIRRELLAALNDPIFMAHIQPGYLCSPREMLAELVTDNDVFSTRVRTLLRDKMEQLRTYI